MKARTLFTLDRFVSEKSKQTLNFVSGISFRKEQKKIKVVCESKKDESFWNGYFLKPQKEREFNEINVNFTAIKKLDKLSKDLLKFLEARSRQNNGDTKISDQRLTEYFGVSRATIGRRLKKLQDSGLITRYCHKFHKKVGPQKNQRIPIVRSERTIRCLRVFVQTRFKPIKNLGWKHDHRPAFNRRNIVVKDGEYRKSLGVEWLISSPLEINNKVHKPVWTYTGDLIKQGVLDKDSMSEWYELDTKRSYGEKEGFEVLGKSLPHDFVPDYWE